MSPPTNHDSEAARDPHPSRWLVAVCGLSLALNWLNRFVLNTDAVAYLQIASHYAEGRTELMVSGYWGPLFSWLAALLIAVGIPSLVAGKLIMVASAVGSFAASRSLLRKAGLSEPAFRYGRMASLVAAVTWSAQNVTPDLLMAALALASLAQLLAPDWSGHRHRPLLAGLGWGLAYLAKPVALPWGVATLLVFLLLRRRSGGELRRTLLTLIVFGLVALPWITVLSVKYGHPTFSTSGRIAHALVGPGESQRYHPTFVTLQPPAAGRVTSWEDPTHLPYEGWSPFASAENFTHQLKLSGGNALKALVLLTTLSLLWPLALRPSAFRAAREALIPLALLVAIYLPVYLAVTEQRYFYPLLPLLWVALTRNASGKEPAGSRTICAVFLASLLPLLAVAVKYQFPERVAGRRAHELAAAIVATGRTGPVAGSALQPGGRTGLYVAWFLGEPWLGDSTTATADEFIASGAHWLLFNATDPRVAQLDRSPAVRRIGPATSPESTVVIFEKR